MFTKKNGIEQMKKTDVDKDRRREELFGAICGAVVTDEHQINKLINLPESEFWEAINDVQSSIASWRISVTHRRTYPKRNSFLWFLRRRKPDDCVLFLSGFIYDIIQKHVPK